MDKIRILVAGSGAVGSYFGGRLALEGHEVSLLCRSDYEEVKAHGVEVRSYQGDFHYYPKECVRKGRELSSPPDFILIATKHLPEIDYQAMLEGAVGPQTCLVLVQNGVGIEEDLEIAFPNNEIIGGIAFIGVSRTGYGKIHHQIAGSLILGSHPKGLSPQTQKLAQAFSQAQVDCRTTESIQKERWKKLIWNVGYNPTSVLARGADTHQLMSHPESLQLIRDLMKEVVQLANGLGHDLKMDLVEKNIEVTKNMNPYKTSMCLDFEAGRPMEIEALLGNAVRLAQQAQIATPRMEALYALLKFYR